jgi:hypothetical protein
MKTRIPARLALAALMALTACGPATDDTGWQPDSNWSNDEFAGHSALFEGLDDPRGIARTDTAWIVAEMDAGRVVAIENGVLTVLADGLDEPYMVAASATGVVVTERGGGRVLHIAAETTVLAEGLGTPGRVVSDGTSAWWVDEEDETIWAADLETGEAAILAEIDDPIGLDWTLEALYVARQGSADCVSRVDLNTGEETVLAEVDENPVDVVATDSGVFMTSESHYWPYGGWIYDVDGESGAVDSLANSPPKPSWIDANDTHVFWMTTENIVAVPQDGGTYETLAILTAPGDLVVTENGLFWTDRHQGSVFTVELP